MSARILASRRLFVAGPSTLREYVATIMAEARNAGWAITYDWTASPLWNGTHDPHEIARTEGLANLLGVAEADAVLWVVMNDYPSQGAPYEAGYARALGKPVVVLESVGGLSGHLYPLIAGPRAHRVSDALEMLDRLISREPTP